MMYGNCAAGERVVSAGRRAAFGRWAIGSALLAAGLGLVAPQMAGAAVIAKESFPVAGGPAGHTTTNGYAVAPLANATRQPTPSTTLDPTLSLGFAAGSQWFNATSTPSSNVSAITTGLAG